MSISADAAMNARIRCLELAHNLLYADSSYGPGKDAKDTVGLAHQFYRYASTGEYPFTGEVPVFFDPDYQPERTVAE